MKDLLALVKILNEIKEEIDVLVQEYRESFYSLETDNYGITKDEEQLDKMNFFLSNKINIIENKYDVDLRFCIIYEYKIFQNGDAYICIKTKECIDKNDDTGYIDTQINFKYSWNINF